MKTIYKIGLAAVIAVSLGLLAVKAQEGCQNKGYVEGWSDCATVDFCSNHQSATTCTTAKIVWQIRNTGTVSGVYIEMYNDVCTQDVQCRWNVFCSEVLGSGGDTHNALFPDEHDC
jgi:phosphoribosylformimino-5-aminoimidazole carboxamide ribonucleotide (ProFAR) isomerase